MQIRLLVAVLVLASCGGTLSDEQRKKMKEKMESQEIRKVSDAELTDAAFEYGRTLATLLDSRDKTLTNRALIDSLEKTFKVKVVSIEPGDSMMLDVESRIIEAYTSGAGKVELSDDVQRLGEDSMLYTKPVIRERPDGSIEFIRALGIHMPKKSIILSIKD